MNKFKIVQIPQEYRQGPFWGNGTLTARLCCIKNKLCLNLNHNQLWEIGTDFQLDSDSEQRIGNLKRKKLSDVIFILEFISDINDFTCETDLETATSLIAIQLSNQEKYVVKIYLDSHVNLIYISIDNTDSNKIRYRMEDCPSASASQQWVSGSEEPESSPISSLYKPLSEERLAVITVLEEKKQFSSRFFLTMSVNRMVNETIVEAINSKLLYRYLKNSSNHYQQHLQDWKNYWKGFNIQIPSKRLQSAFELEMYKLYCKMRNYSLEDSKIEPDIKPAAYHDVKIERMNEFFCSNLNTQSIQWTSLKTGNYRLLNSLIENYTTEFCIHEDNLWHRYGIKNAKIKSSALNKNKRNYGPYTELTAAAYLCQYSKYNQNIQLQSEYIYPHLKKIIIHYMEFMRKNGLSIEPKEDADNSKMEHALLPVLLSYVLEHLISYAQFLGRESDHFRYLTYQQLLAALTPMDLSRVLFHADDTPPPATKEKEKDSSVLPPEILTLLLCQQLINDSTGQYLNHLLDKHHGDCPSEILPFFALAAARCKRDDLCRRLLEKYCMHFQSPFTDNFNWYNMEKPPISRHTPSSAINSDGLDSGLILPAALCDMIAHRAGNTIYIGAAIPSDWDYFECYGIRVEKGHKLWIKAEKYKLKELKILPACDENIDIKCCYGVTRTPNKGGEPKKIKLEMTEGRLILLSFS